MVAATFNLVPPHWEPLLTNVNSGYTFEFVDGESQSHPSRFFRVKLFP